MTTNQQFNRKQGFSLTEVVVGLNILMVVFAGVFKLTFWGLHLEEKAEATRYFAQAIQDEFETLHNSRWEEVSQLSNYDNLQVSDDYPELDIFSPKLIRLALDSNTNQRKIIYLYSWTDRSNNVHNGSVQTYVSKGGLSDASYRHF